MLIDHRLISFLQFVVVEQEEVLQIHNKQILIQIQDIQHMEQVDELLCMILLTDLLVF